MGRLCLADSNLMEPLGFVCLHRMGLALHQSGHGHSHGNSRDDSSQHQNASVRAAFIHVIGDLLQSVGVLIAAYIIYFKVRTGHLRGMGQLLGRRGRLMLMRPGLSPLQPEYKYVDPICTFLFSILVLGTTLTILRDVILVLMEGNSDLRALGVWGRVARTYADICVLC